MKLRIKGNSIRVRLSETEVNSLAEGTAVIEETCFPSSSLAYKVQMSSAGSVEFKDNVLTVNLAKADINDWATTDLVSISKEFPVIKGNILSILVEKDFKCLTVRPEDESELYPNPNKHH
jgi:uncharacterized protein DUF7009